MSFDIPDWGNTNAFSYHFDQPPQIPVAITGDSKKRKGGPNSIVQKKQKLSNGATQENSLIAKTEKKKEAEQTLTNTSGNPKENGVHHKKNKNKYKEINEEQKRKKENNGGIKWHPSRCISDEGIADNKVTKVLEVEEKNGGKEESFEGIKKKRKIAEINSKDVRDEDAGLLPQDKNVAGLTNGTLEVRNGEVPGKNKKQKKKNKKTSEKSKVENDETSAGPIIGSDLSTKKLKKKGKEPLEERENLEVSTVSEGSAKNPDVNGSLQEITLTGDEEIVIKTKKKRKKKKSVEGNTVPTVLTKKSNIDESQPEIPDAGNEETSKKTKKQKKLERKALENNLESANHTTESSVKGNVRDVPEGCITETPNKSKKQKKKEKKVLDSFTTETKDTSNTSVQIESTLEKSSKEEHKKSEKIKGKTKKMTIEPPKEEQATTSKEQSGAKKGKKKKKKNQELKDEEEEKAFLEKDPKFTSDLGTLLNELNFDQFDPRDFEEKEDDSDNDMSREVEDLSEEEMLDYEEESENKSSVGKVHDDGDIADDESEGEVENKRKKNKLEKKKKEAIPEPSPGNKKLDKKILKEMLKKDKKVVTSEPEPEKEQPKLSAAEALRQKMTIQLNAARFRMVNEELYTTTSKNAMAMFKKDPDAFKSYHLGYQNQVEQWPINPLNIIINWLKKQPREWVVADFGCGEARLSLSAPQKKVYSFDLVAANNRVTACDMAHTPLKSGSVDVVVFCLSLMGTNIKDFVTEANRVLRHGGVMKVAEVESRFTNLNDFLSCVTRLGFHCTHKDVQQKYFYMFDFKKNRDCKKAMEVPEIVLKPCMYKKR
ncbi:ribosomal RNA-processing protein 8-like [Penaeus chinensis]|uniref:ribosomal RNA-processing protein 8-like n=1 Tax=Penaeus chinensis TaxID=139456 RepID=UPI001FB6F661|nr:ribosomal RNA-processing protein 8-like [Penaeus chinensis]